MPNQWDAVGKGLLTGLSNFGEGYNQKLLKKKALEDYHTGMSNLKNSYSKLQEQTISWIDGVPLGKVQTEVPPDPKAEQNFFDAQTELAGNPYGQPYLSALNTQYQSMQPSYQYKEVGNNLLRIDNRGGVKEVYKSEPKDKEKHYQLKGVLRIEKDDNGNYTAVEQVFDPSTGEPIEKQRKSDENEYNQFYQQGDFAPKTTRGRSPGRMGSPKDTTTVKEKELDSDLIAYRKALTDQNGEKVKYYEDKYGFLGMDINKLNEEYEYQGTSPKDKRKFLNDKVRTSEQINEAYNQTYGDIQMDDWWKDLYNAVDEGDFNGKVGYYEEYLNKEVLPYVAPEVGKKLWSVFQNSKARVYNDKRFWE